jgi:hypothetical protein
MKKIMIIAALLLGAESLSAAENSTFYGPKNLSDREFKDLKINGPSELDKIKAHSISIAGSLKANELTATSVNIKGPSSLTNSKLNMVDAHGPSEIAGSTVLGKVNVYGPALFQGEVKVMGQTNAIATAFEKTLTTSGSKNVFEKVAAKKIIVKKPNSKAEKPQTVTIKASNIAEIVFESGDGQVEADKESVVSRVVGGTLHKPS